MNEKKIRREDRSGDGENPNAGAQAERSLSVSLQGDEAEPQERGKRENL